MSIENRIPIEFYIVKLTNNYFKKHDELLCCENKKLTEGTWKKIKENAEYEWKQQFKTETRKQEEKKRGK